jgi:hypothetical protein
MGDLQEALGPIRRDMAALLAGFDKHQLAAIAEFLARCTDLIYRHGALLRAETRCGAAQSAAAKTANAEENVR